MNINKRKLEENIMKTLMIGATVIVAASLLLILGVIFVKGFSALSIDMLIKTPKGGYYTGGEGGILNAILGSLALGIGATFTAFLVSAPLVFYINLYLKKGSRFTLAIRFFFGCALGNTVNRLWRVRVYRDGFLWL